jgi:hypothetical protein
VLIKRANYIRTAQDCSGNDRIVIPITMHGAFEKRCRKRHYDGCTFEIVDVTIRPLLVKLMNPLNPLVLQNTSELS